MKYDDILEKIGDFGPYQKRVYFLLCLPAAMKAAIIMTTVFTFSLPDYECISPGIHLKESELDSHLREVITSKVNVTSLPHELSSVNTDSCWVPTQIEVSINSSFTVNVSVDSLLGKHVKSLPFPSRVKCNEWKYDTTEIQSSVMTEFDFVCDNSIMRSHASMGFFAGSLFGAFLIGILADVIGRKHTLLVCVLFQLVCGVSVYFIDVAVGVLVIRSLQGVAAEMFAVGTTTGMELVGPKRQTFAGMVVDFFWSGGQLLVLLVAYLSKEWRTQQLVFGLSAVPMLVVIWLFTPESPRWLIEKKKIKDATVVLDKICQANKTQLPENALHDTESLYGTEYSVLTFFRNWTLLIRSLIIFYNWFTVNFLYYGLSLNLDNLSGSIYVNFLISLVVETTGFVICFALLDRTGRKGLYTVSMFIGAVACLCVTFPVVFGNSDHQWIVTTLCMLGKMCVSMCYAILYIMTIELFPTVVRNSALGVCMVFENVAGMIAPYITDLGLITNKDTISQAIPLLVYGGLATLAAVVSLHLPETVGRSLPETIEDALHITKDKRTKSLVKATEMGASTLL